MICNTKILPEITILFQINLENSVVVFCHLPCRALLFKKLHCSRQTQILQLIMDKLTGT